VTAGTSRNVFLSRAPLAPGATGLRFTGILIGGEGWEAVPGGYESAGSVAADPEGGIVFRDAGGEKAWRIGADGRPVPFPALSGPFTGLAFGPDGRAYVTEGKAPRVSAYRADGSKSVVAENIQGRDLLVTHGGSIYLTEPGSGESPSGRVWLVAAGGGRTLLDSGLNHPSGIALSPDGLWLAVAEGGSHWGYSYRVSPDGRVGDKQRFYHFEVPDEADDSGCGAWAMDVEGRLYAATRMGVQTFDRNGRVRAILPVPGGGVTGLAFGGAHFDTLYVCCADHRIYRRKLRVAGAPPWGAPIALPDWTAG